MDRKSGEEVMNDEFMWGMIVQALIAGSLSAIGMIQLSAGQQFVTAGLLLIVAGIFHKKG
jgi:hypothetical protein